MTLDEPSPGPGIRPGRVTRPAGRWLMLALSGLLAAGLVAAGAAGISQYISTFWLYRGFPPPSMPQHVTVRGKGGTRQVKVFPATVESFTLRSQALGGYPDPVYVVLPPGYPNYPTRRYPVLYLLHGYPGEPAQFLNVGQVVATESTLVAAGRMKPVILVMPTGGRSLLADEEWANGVRPHNAWETFVARDLVSAIDARYRTIASAAGRGIAGLSAGGYGALNIGLHHPSEFSLLESWSGYMAADAIPAIFDHSAKLLDYNSPARWLPSVAGQVLAQRTYIWFYIGTKDPLAPQNRAFNAQLSALGLAHAYFESPGKHTWALWRGLMPRALTVASEHLSHG